MHEDFDGVKFGLEIVAIALIASAAVVLLSWLGVLR